MNACDSVGNTLQYYDRAWGPMKLVRVFKMHLNETHSRIHIGKHLSDHFILQNDLRKGDALLPVLFNSVCVYQLCFGIRH
jgi:hypothetical protein